MKAFIISIIILTVLILSIILNIFYIHNICDQMLKRALELSPQDISGAESLYEFWKENEPIFSISIHDSHIERINELTVDIKSAAAIGNGTDFEKNIILLTELLEELKSNEKISFQGII